jgi:alanine-synthesizing transaminase
MRRLRDNLAELDHQLAQQKSCARLHIQGGWYAVLRIPVTRSDENFAIDLLRSSAVLIHPGHFYDFPSEGHLVLSLITPEGEFGDGVAHVLEFANNV